VFAGAAVALTVHLLLTLLGSAIGLSVHDRVRAENLSTAAAVWAVFTTVLSLFIGGWVTTQCAVGENRAEAVIHGIILWGVLFAGLLWLVASGVRSGFGALVGMANATQAAAVSMSEEGWENAARRAGVPQERIDEWRRQAATAPEAVRQAVNNPANRQAAEEGATRAAWWTLIGIVLSMASAVGGAVAGSGPALRLVPASATVTRTRVAVH
jgi:hypothetical protein